MLNGKHEREIGLTIELAASLLPITYARLFLTIDEYIQTSTTAIYTIIEL